MNSLHQTKAFILSCPSLSSPPPLLSCCVWVAVVTLACFFARLVYPAIRGLDELRKQRKAEIIEK